ncbi:hypothetical protein A8O28_13115 [Enterobacteriaceae bacterium CCUG 67584]|nr:hypothetical protein [Enterobacteriaceae bacterium CCUG 67584]
MANHRGGSGNFAEDGSVHPRRAVKADRVAAVTLRTTRSGHPKREKKADKIVAVADANPQRNPLRYIFR